MKYFHTEGQVGPDGKILIMAPADFANKKVSITVESEAGSDNAAPSPTDWQRFVRETSGSIPDFPDVDRPGPGSYEQRERLD